MKNIVLNNRLICDLEMLLNGSFQPLNGFLMEKDYHSVLDNMRLSNGKLWPIPIVLPVDKEFVNNNIDELILFNSENLPIAKIVNPEFYKPDLNKECLSIFKSLDTNHPYIKLILERKDKFYVGGKVESIQKIVHFDFPEYRKNPSETKKFIKENNWHKIVGFQTRNPMHKSHYELTKYALKKAGDNAKLLLQPIVGVTQECDVNYHTRVRCYKKLLKYYPENTVELCLLPLSMRMAGPREALWHALIRQNYGCTHFVVGRDHAGPSYKKKNGDSFFGPFDAHELINSVNNELDIQIIKSQFIVYVKNLDKYLPMDEVPENSEIMHISGTKQRELLNKGEPIPEWFTFPDIVDELKDAYKSKKRQGFLFIFLWFIWCRKNNHYEKCKSQIARNNQ